MAWVDLPQYHQWEWLISGMAPALIIYVCAYLLCKPVPDFCCQLGWAVLKLAVAFAVVGVPSCVGAGAGRGRGRHSRSQSLSST